ncbi:MAG: hypothetical protein CK548_08750 [Opitutia bacterium]|nr:hypothetical protein [Opitutaceae bacterium]PHX70655.1 MAG: hypothetical protein CK548_08750 [Opitutae bacterium]
MVPQLSRARSLALLVVALLGAATPLSAGFLGFGAPKDADVNVVVDMTEAGRKISPPTKEKPAFYYPVLAGYRESGSLVAGEKSPPPTPVAKLLAKALAAQHYYVMGTKTPAPTLILVFHWGYMNPQIDDTGDDENPQQIFWNQKEMLALVAGNTVKNVGAFGSDREDILQNMRDDRYFVIVSAYDFDAAKEKKKVLLWQAKMSTPSNRVSLAEVIPSMITAGGPRFGRETKLPESVTAPLAKEGKVEVGTPVVVPDGPDKAKKPEPAKK